MGRNPDLVRHLVVVVVGAAIIWIAFEVTPTLLGLVPGYSDQVSAWYAVHPQKPVITAVILSLLLAAALSLIQEGPRWRGLPASMLFGMIGGLVAFLSRLSSTPTGLYDVAASVAAVWAAGMITAAVVMHLSKKRLIRNEEPVISGAG